MTSPHLAGVALEMRWLQPLYCRLSDRPELLRALESETGLRRVEPGDCSLLAHASFCLLIERLHAAGEPHVCAWLALQFDASVGFGQVYFLRSCLQLREMLADLMTNQPLMLPFGYYSFLVDWDASSFEVRLQPFHPPTRLASQLLAEGALAWIKRIFDLSLPASATPLSACTMAGASPCDQSLDVLLGAPVQFAASHCALRFPVDLLDQTFPGGNPRIKHAMRAGFVALVRNSDAPTPMSLKIISCFLSHDGNGKLDVESVATRLVLSVGELRRQLRVEGMLFSDLLNAHRRRQAFQWLVVEGAAVESVVRSLGYASRSSLERAFAGWFDTTPAMARRDRLQLAAQTLAEDWSDPVALLRLLPRPSHNPVSLEHPQQPAQPVLQAYLLGLANRAEYGGGLLDDVRGLARQLGGEPLHQWIRGLQLQSGAGQLVPALEPLWSSYLTALSRLSTCTWFMELDADEQWRVQQDLAWYELGALLICRMVGAPYERLLVEAQTWPRAQLLGWERQHFGLDRHIAGAMLLSAWGLPRHVIRTQREASQPVTTPALRLAALFSPPSLDETAGPLCEVGGSR